jgi:two-component system, OmpR family, sensor histidine kinase QseC
MLPRSLAARLMLATLLALLASAATAVVVMLVLRGGTPEELVREDLADEARDLRDGLRLDPGGRLRVELAPEVGNVYDAMPADAAYWLTDHAGNTVLASPPGPALAALKALPAGATDVRVSGPTHEIQLRVMDAAIGHEGKAYRLRIGRSDRLVTTLKDYGSKLYLRAGVTMAILALMTFAVVICLTVNRMVRPLRRASTVAARVGPRNLGARLRSEGLPSEVVPLIEAFNAALARLEQGYRVQQEFLAAAAHELKTPLALLQAEIELSGAPNTALLLRDTSQMARQVHQLLHLAEVSEGHNYAFALTSLPDVVNDAADYLARLATQHDVSVLIEVPDDAVAPVEADASAVFVLVKNLLENALHHSPAGSEVRIALRADGFSVQDAGPGVEPAHRELLFKRFWRGAPGDSEGAGLGLAICMEICLSHGWTLQLASGTPGCGACFIVSTG